MSYVNFFFFFTIKLTSWLMLLKSAVKNTPPQRKPTQTKTSKKQIINFLMPLLFAHVHDNALIVFV